MPFNAYLALGALLAIIGAFIAGDIHRGNADEIEYTAKIEKQNAEAEHQLVEANAKTAAVEKMLAERNIQTEADNARRIQEISAKNADLARLADDLDRLRRRPGGGKGGDSGVPGAAQPAAQRGGTAAPDGGGAPGSFRELAEIAVAAVDLARRGETCHEYAVPVTAAP